MEEDDRHGRGAEIAPDTGKTPAARRVDEEI
jgi:hypothetical protein